MKLRNKKAQIGQGVISFPVFIIVFFIMGLLVYLSTTWSALSPAKAGAEPYFLNYSENFGNLLVQRVNVELFDGQRKEMLFLDAVILRRNDRISEEKFLEAVKSLIQRENICLSIFTSQSQTAQSEDWGFGNLKDRGIIELPPYGTLAITYPFSSIGFHNENEEIEIKYYYGRCRE